MRAGEDSPTRVEPACYHVAGMPWIAMNLRGASVLARCDAGGRLAVEGGRVEIRYKPNDGRAYRATAANLAPSPGASVLPDEHCAPAEAAPSGAASARAGARGAGARGAGGAKQAGGSAKAGAAGAARAPVHPEGAIIVYADGACSGNPGPAGLGVVVLDGERWSELSEYLGVGTNNIAELTAILRAAQELAGSERPVRMYTDSRYSIGVLTQGWKAKKNPELVATVRAALAGLRDVELHYVPGHAGVALNERADTLARDAVSTRANAGWVRARRERGASA